MGSWSAPTVFLDGSTFKLISGEYNGNFYGWYWNGSTWISDSSIVSGLTDVGWNSAPTVFLDGSTFKLISGEEYGKFLGWYWNGSTWISDSSIVSGLTDVGLVSRPTVFLDGSTFKLISGERYGKFLGWYILPFAVGDIVLLVPNYGDIYDRAAIKGGDISVGDNVNLYPLKAGAKVAIKESWLAGDKIIF